MVSYAYFETKSDRTKELYDFLVQFFYDCECMAKTYEGIIFHLKDNTHIKVEVQYLKDVFIGNNYIIINYNFRSQANNPNHTMDFVLMFDSIKKMEILPDNPERWE